MTNGMQLAEIPRALCPSRQRVLLVDDNVDDLLYYTAILQHLSLDVRPSVSFTEAASLFARENFALVIISQGGTSFEGRSVLARAVEAESATPVLVLARGASMDSHSEAMPPGAFDPADKRLTPSEVAQLLAPHLRSTAPIRHPRRSATPHELVPPVH